MITRLRIALFILVIALARAGSVAGMLAPAAGGSEATLAENGLRQTASEEPTSIERLERPAEAAAHRLQLRLTIHRVAGGSGGDSPSRRITPDGSGSLHDRIAWPAAWIPVVGSPDIAQASALTRAGATSSFGTSLPPPPHA